MRTIQINQTVQSNTSSQSNSIVKSLVNFISFKSVRDFFSFDFNIEFTKEDIKEIEAQIRQENFRTL